MPPTRATQVLRSLYRCIHVYRFLHIYIYIYIYIFMYMYLCRPIYLSAFIYMRNTHTHTFFKVDFDAFWIRFRTFGVSFLEHFRTILESFLEFWGNLPRHPQRAPKKHRKNHLPSSILRHLGAQVGATWAQDGGQERQDRPT